MSEYLKRVRNHKRKALFFQASLRSSTQTLRFFMHSLQFLHRAVWFGLLLMVGLCTPFVTAQTCNIGEAENQLDVNRVRARVFNTGGLFWKSDTGVFEVPRTTGRHAMYAAGLWVGGEVDGELRFAGSDYGPYEFWPGPLDAMGRPPSEWPTPFDCDRFDRIFSITRADIINFETQGIVSDDLRDWPFWLGAPVVDGDGNPNNYHLNGGDRPALKADQILWWVMHDRGGEHQWSGSPSLGLEVQVTAHAVANTSSVLDDTIFFTYKMINKGGGRLTNTYFGLWADPNLGDPVDDYIGVDSLLQVGYVWNGDDFDGSVGGYGDRPPALGIAVVEGPSINNDGRDNDRDGEVDEDDESLGLGTFLYRDLGGASRDRPSGGARAYDYLQGRFGDFGSMTFGGNGFTGDGSPTRMLYSGDPPAFWSEADVDSASTANAFGDRWFVLGIGPYTHDEGAVQTVTLAYVWAQGTDRFDSIRLMKEGVETAREYWNEEEAPEPDPPPTVVPRLVAPGDGAVGQPTNLVLVWTDTSSTRLTYTVELAHDPRFNRADRYNARGPTFEPNNLAPEITYYWRVRAINDFGGGPWSTPRKFTTGSGPLVAAGAILLDEERYAFVEVVGPGGVDPCGPQAASTFGCAEVGGNFVYPSFNSTSQYILYHQGDGPEATLVEYVPNDFELRFTAEGSIAYHVFTAGTALQVPFEVWDIGNTGPFNENDPVDDVRMIPIVFSDNGGECDFAYGELSDATGSAVFGRPATDRIYAYYPKPGRTYADWATAVEPLVDADSEGCPEGPATEEAASLIDLDAGRPLQHLIVVDNDDADGDGVYDGIVQNLQGAVVRFYTVKTFSDAPIPSNPGPGMVVGSRQVQFYWYGPDHMEAFDLQVATDSTFATGLVVDERALTSPFYSWDGPEDGAQYYWRVRGINAREETGPWTAVSAFQVVLGTATEAAGSGIPKTHRLEGNYPNPFRSSTHITFGLPEPADVRLTVHDVLGRHVATLVDGWMPAGWHRTTWGGSFVGSGVYFYRMQSGPFVRTQQMVRIK